MGGEGFAPSAASAAGETSASVRVGGVAALGSLDALLALQQTGSPLERKRRAIRRAGGLLDALDQVKLALLDESADPASALERLRLIVRDARAGTDEAALEGVLDEVDVRAEVELAKAEILRIQPGRAA